MFGHAQGIYGAAGFHRDAFVGEDFDVERGVVGHEEVVFEEFPEAGLAGAALEFGFVRDHFGGDVMDGHRAKGDVHAGGRFEVFADAFAGGGVFVGQLEEAGRGGGVRGFGVEEEEGHGEIISGFGGIQDVFRFCSCVAE